MKSTPNDLHVEGCDDPEVTALRLREDHRLCREKKMPSTLVLHLPTARCRLLEDVSWHLTPQSEIPMALRWTRCESIIQGIRAYLNQLDTVADNDADRPKSSNDSIPTSEEYHAALKVLDYLHMHNSISQLESSSPLSDVILAVRTQLGMDSSRRAQHHASHAPDTRKDKYSKFSRCYICCYRFPDSEAHDLYPSLCRSCGMFNIASSRVSLPEKLDLSRKTALITGGRINLGYHTALRMLRCGARVIVSSRYPADAATRYAKEPDFEQWSSSLRVVGADFRAASDAFRLVHVVKELLRAWDGRHNSDSRMALDILINNAAQTLTDPVNAEMKAISREGAFKDLPGAKALLAGGASVDYQPRLRGGMQASWIPSIEEGQTQQLLENGIGQDSLDEGQVIQKGLRTTSDIDSDSRSSWVQSLSEIPYEDLISAHSVNAFVPLILCRELLPLMGAAGSSSTLESKPVGYIVNVSSREGILEDMPNSRSKAGHHVHTNMSKAAINMITETEAGKAWKTRRVAMNSVDPGYMSAAPECQPKNGCPIGFEDGAARVLWPIAVGEVEDRVISGRFLKHFERGAAVVSRLN
ncbi:hypothetical protein N7474_002798 [Penicillium riverlandense]|uniref:uncharacterized protein n=1 Tax=Penicillium riverlandense TaxID=1903569 RepID=UPI002548CBD3|nr:uncharacterized protein N7474_002798 [Penicillium riverlandense]KAJ5825660.1 hypothetical protein N7474_002798 [Penicillium riverlandense]